MRKSVYDVLFVVLCGAVIGIFLPRTTDYLWYIPWLPYTTIFVYGAVPLIGGGNLRSETVFSRGSS
ncbi:MAG: hypothetical protein KatS3mg017_0016 [Fimbriimonadales bacterium]|nr:MAG: hypothetical protein KatS3mg017_0016 [Fimbriimonadales bacterium]